MNDGMVRPGDRRGQPKAIIDKIRRDTAKVLQEPAVRREAGGAGA